MHQSQSHHTEQLAPPTTVPLSLDLPAERLRPPTSDELPVDLADPDQALPLDESDRAREDAGPLLD
jgi:hypothetical protein